jgi:hypothetical protein
MKTIHYMLIATSVIPLMAGCSSTPVTLNSVGPAPISVESFTPKGYLQVFTATETRELGDNTYYYPHTGYSIHDESGKMIKFVPNHTGDMDESPAFVTVPAGKYDIVAESESYGRVTVPVAIAEGRATVVHLDRDWKLASNTPAGQVVRLPDGEAVGWSSSANNTPP